jgi:hypothetical protein
MSTTNFTIIDTIAPTISMQILPQVLLLFPDYLMLLLLLLVILYLLLLPSSIIVLLLLMLLLLWLLQFLLLLLPSSYYFFYCCYNHFYEFYNYYYSSYKILLRLPGWLRSPSIYHCFLSFSVTSTNITILKLFFSSFVKSLYCYYATMTVTVEKLHRAWASIFCRA